MIRPVGTSTEAGTDFAATLKTSKISGKMSGDDAVLIGSNEDKRSVEKRDDSLTGLKEQTIFS